MDEIDIKKFTAEELGQLDINDPKNKEALIKFVHMVIDIYKFCNIKK